LTHDASTQEEVVLVDVEFAGSLEDLGAHVEREKQLVSLEQTTTRVPTAVHNKTCRDERSYRKPHFTVVS